MNCSLTKHKTDPACKALMNVAYIALDAYKDEPGESLSSLTLQLSSCVQPIRAKRAEILRRPIDRLASLAAGALLEITTAEFTRQKFVSIIEGRYGKPDYSENSGLHFSLSHSHTAACCAVSHHPIGVDVEGLIDSYEDLCAMCLTSDEYTYISQLPNQTMRIHTFTKLWTRKEALGKYLGFGIDESVLRINVLNWPPRTTSCSYSIFCNTNGECQPVPQLETFYLNETYISVCGHGKTRISNYTVERILAVHTTNTYKSL